MRDVYFHYSNAHMRLGLKLVALGVILLLSKTEVYLSNTSLSEVQIVPARPISGPIAHRDVNATGYLTVSADGKQAKRFTCGAKPGDDGSDTVAVHETDKSPKGS